MKRTPVPIPGSQKYVRTQTTSSKAALSQEFVRSDDDSANENARRPKGAGKQQPKTTIAVHPPPPRKPAPKQIVIQDDTTKRLSSPEETSDSDSDSSSETSSDGESDTIEAPHSAQKPSQVSVVQSSQPQSYVVDSRPAPAFVPPRGFNPVPLNDKTTSTTTQIFGNSKGKQIWHMTAPTGVSLDALKELAMDSALKGETVVTYKGSNYSFSKTEASEESPRAILIPQKHGYGTSVVPIYRTLHLQAAVRLPKLSSKQANRNTGSEATASITRSTIRAPRPQVKGLKMRFLPIGSGSAQGGILGESDSEEDLSQEAAGPGQSSGSLTLPLKKEKRKHVEVNGHETHESVTKKHKKHRTLEEKKRRKEQKMEKERKESREA